MKISLSTNWCNRRFETGEEIVDKALELGVDELELGFHTTQLQAQGFMSRRDEMPVGSIHAFCPVPLSAPCGHPELYTLASPDENARGIARIHLLKNIRFAAEIGADCVVHHAGRVSFSGFFSRDFDSGFLRTVREKCKNDIASAPYAKALAKAKAVRRKRGAKILDAFLRELDSITPELEKSGVVLALENLPYLEGFPDESEMSGISSRFKDGPVMAWFDTGHHRVRECHGWLSAEGLPDPGAVAGMHLNDVKDFNDDHFPPGEGNVDFAALAEMASRVRHVVVEPSHTVKEDALKRGIAYAKARFSASRCGTCGSNGDLVYCLETKPETQGGKQ